MIMRNAQTRAISFVLIALSAWSGAFADEHGGHGHEHFDSRFAHNRSYFDVGYRPPGPPRTGFAIEHGPDHLWYDHGQWYRHDGAGWLVAHAPVGVFVPELPPFYTTIWFGGIPYYYANDTYYAWEASHDQYEVVQPPSGIEAGASTHAPPDDTLFVYPKNGQSTEQQDHDRYDCYTLATQQTGYDLTKPDGGVPPAEAPSKRSDYLRADSACLEGRGYSVK